MKTKFRLINKSDNVVKSFTKTHDVSIHLLGRRISNYIVIKSDDYGDRVINLTSSIIAEIEKEILLA